VLGAEKGVVREREHNIESDGEDQLFVEKAGISRE